MEKVIGFLKSPIQYLQLAMVVYVIALIITMIQLAITGKVPHATIFLTTYCIVGSVIVPIVYYSHRKIKSSVIMSVKFWINIQSKYAQCNPTFPDIAYYDLINATKSKNKALDKILLKLLIGKFLYQENLKKIWYTDGIFLFTLKDESISY